MTTRLKLFIAGAGTCSFLAFAILFTSAGEWRKNESLTRTLAALSAENKKIEAEHAEALRQKAAEYAVCAGSLDVLACRKADGYAPIGSFADCAAGGKAGLRACYLSGGARLHAQWTACAVGAKTGEMRRYMGSIWRDVILPERRISGPRSLQHKKLLVDFSPP